MNEKISDERLKEKIEETKEYIDLCEERKFYPLYGVAERLSIYEELLSLRSLNARLVENGERLVYLLKLAQIYLPDKQDGLIDALDQHTALMKEIGG